MFTNGRNLYDISILFYYEHECDYETVDIYITEMGRWSIVLMAYSFLIISVGISLHII